jgi:uncharacterized membrane protein YkoI
MHARLPFLLLGLTLALAIGRVVAQAVDDEDDADHGHGRRAWEDNDHSHDRARRAMEKGEILPIAEILRRTRPQAPGRILDTELEYEHGQWIYEIKFLDPEGRLYELEIAARNGEILRRWEGR